MQERRSRAGVEKQEEQEIQGAMKYHIILGLIIIAGASTYHYINTLVSYIYILYIYTYIHTYILYVSVCLCVCVFVSE